MSYYNKRGPKPRDPQTVKSTTIQTCVTPGVADALDARAAIDGVSKSEIVNRALRAYLVDWL